MGPPIQFVKSLPIAWVGHVLEGATMVGLLNEIAFDCENNEKATKKMTRAYIHSEYVRYQAF